MAGGVRIATLHQRPDLAPVAARWVWQAFWKARGHRLAEIEALAAKATRTAGPPHCFVLLEDGTPAGTASLIAHDLDARPDLTPWLAAMWVEPAFRVRGHALRLVRAVEDQARRDGAETLWLYTLTARGLYEQAGWRCIEGLASERGPASLMRRDLAPVIPGLAEREPGTHER